MAVKLTAQRLLAMKSKPVFQSIFSFFERICENTVQTWLFSSVGFLLLVTLSLPALAQTASDDRLTVRVKDVADIEGVRDNQLIGYGIVVGLNRTGDRVQQNI